jgi:antitoxin component YwqK of YwqJK toxin-antitoxin module
MKKRLIILFISVIIGIFILKTISKSFANTDTLFGRISNVLNDNNTVEICCIGLDKKDIDISWNSETTEPIFIIENGRKTHKVGYEYGKNQFNIKLPNDLDFKVGHFKTNNWHSHRYEFNINKDSNGYKIGWVAIGPDFEKYEQSFDLNGQQNGQVIGYYENGKYSFRGQYEHGLKQKKFIYYHNNGQIRVINEFLNDTLHGYSTDFDESGNLIGKTKYIKGQRIENE